MCAKGRGLPLRPPRSPILAQAAGDLVGLRSGTARSFAFVDHHEWRGTRDLAVFLSVLDAIEFQQKHGWDKVRVACHALAREAEERIRH